MTTSIEPEPRVGCAVDADGRITFGVRLPSAGRPRLLLQPRPKKGQPEKAPHVLDLEPSEDGRLVGVLDDNTALAEGRWDVYLLDEPDGERQRLRPGPRDLRVLVDGGARDRSSPVEVRVPYVTKSGYLSVRTWVRAAHAEADRIVVTDDGTIDVTGRLHGAAFGAGAVVRMRVRGTDTVRKVEPRVEDDGLGFSFTVGCDELAGPVSGDGVWDVHVRPAASAPAVRVGRLLDDVADRKEVFVYPSAEVDGCEVRPYYTMDNDLSVEVARIARAAGTAGTAGIARTQAA
ncbi:transferase [Streptomyces sp. M41(2017)]|uniref:transferase n=1 Tax=unclassified Streptomyces TaxID=2593676 RepID=UPI0009BFEF0F|nr:transferase [Streptomyces sp. M41(2017)]OQQ18345.1 transferase [Streptomyces sp. M41(2017)]